MSAKTSTTPGRRTPMSLSGTVTKGQPNKGGNMTHNSGGNANGNFAASHTRQDNKQQQQHKAEQQSSGNQSSDIKENSNKKPHYTEKRLPHQNDNKKPGSEKSQNGVNNKQQQNKEKQHQNGNDGKLSEKDKKEKLEKQDIPEKQDKTEKQDKSEKEDKPEKQDKTEKPNKVDKEDKPCMEEPQPMEVKNDQETDETKKEDNKLKEVKEDKNDVENKIDENRGNVEQVEKTVEETKSKDLTESKIADAEKEENIEKVEVKPEEEQQQQKTPPVTPKGNNRGSKTSTPSHKTPAKASEKTPPKSVTASKSFKTVHIVTREVTTAIDAIDVDVEMEPLAVENSPIKTSHYGEAANINIPLAPTATSTPGKIFLPKKNTAAPKSDVQLAMLTGLSTERPKTFSHISGRKSIRPISDYTPSKFQSNTQFRESYRRINTELDATNTSLNVTVGSEVPNNASFSFFGRGRKRDRTPPQHSQSAIGELQTDMEISPPKKARYDMQGFFNAVASPLSLLRNRFSKATLKSSTPVKLVEKLNSAEDEIEVQNVSGVSTHEEIDNAENDSENTTTNSEDDATLGAEADGNQAKKNDGIDVATDKGELQFEDKELKNVSLKIETSCAMESEQSDIKITETPLHPVVGDTMAKNKRCVVM